jgi:rare lipoprotein A
MYGMSAAHKKLPFGTIVVVTNEENGKSVVVRINDRGPFIDGRIIDMSYGSAYLLDMIRAGVVPVRVDIISIGKK